MAATPLLLMPMASFPLLPPAADRRSSEGAAARGGAGLHVHGVHKVLQLKAGGGAASGVQLGQHHAADAEVGGLALGFQLGCLILPLSLRSNRSRKVWSNVRWTAVEVRRGTISGESKLSAQANDRYTI